MTTSGFGTSHPYPIPVPKYGYFPFRPKPGTGRGMDSHPRFEVIINIPSLARPDSGIAQKEGKTMSYICAEMKKKN